MVFGVRTRFLECQQKHHVVWVVGVVNQDTTVRHFVERSHIHFVTSSLLPRIRKSNFKCVCDSRACKPFCCVVPAAIFDLPLDHLDHESRSIVTSRSFPRLAECHELGMGLTPTDDWTDQPFECSCWNACWMSGTSTLSFPFGQGCSWEHGGTYTRLQGGATQAGSTKGRNGAQVESTHERDPWEIRRRRSCETIPELRWEIEPEDKRRRRDQTLLATEAVQSRDRSRGSEPSPRQVGKMSFLFKSKRSPAEAVQKLQAGFDELESGDEKVRTTDSDIVTEQEQERRRWKEKD